jgi:hypothetical protein
LLKDTLIPIARDDRIPAENDLLDGPVHGGGHVCASVQVAKLLKCIFIHEVGLPVEGVHNAPTDDAVRARSVAGVLAHYSLEAAWPAALAASLRAFLRRLFSCDLLRPSFMLGFTTGDAVWSAPPLEEEDAF